MQATHAHADSRSSAPHGTGGEPKKAAVIRDLSEQSLAARALVESMRALIGDDDEIIDTAVEGETDLHEALAAALGRLAELDALRLSIDTLMSSLQARGERLAKQREAIRTAMCVAMECGAVKTIEMPLGTVSMRTVAPAVEVTDESAIPAVFWRPQAPKLDKRMLLQALKSGAVAGACLTPPSTTISVRFS